MTNTIKTCEAPTVSLLGIGGCGVNLVREIYKHTNDLVNFSNYLDCSEANQYDGEDVYIVANLFGGGKVRETNLDSMKARIPQLDETVLGDSDIYILVGSLAGATGGVMIPLLIKELHSRGKKVIVGLVSEAIDERGTKNTRASLKTLIALTDKLDLFLPTVLTHTDRGRAEADYYVITQIVAIISVLCQPCYEIDKNDRLNWLNGSKTVGLEAGLHSIYGVVDASDTTLIEDLQDKHLIAESVLNFGIRMDNGARRFVSLPIEHARFSKDGLLAKSKTPVSGIIANTTTTLSKILSEIEKKCLIFDNKTKSPISEFKAKLFSSGDEDINQFI